MKKGIERMSRRVLQLLIIMTAVALVACDDDPDPAVNPEPEVFNFRYLSVVIETPIDGNAITAVTFNADDLKDYSYVLLATGSRRINCLSSTFIDADDTMVTEDENSVSFSTDADVVFDVVDLNGNITRFSPSVTGAVSKLIHNAGVPLSQDVRSVYTTEVTKQVNKLPNQVYEIR